MLPALPLCSRSHNCSFPNSTCSCELIKLGGGECQVRTVPAKSNYFATAVHAGKGDTLVGGDKQSDGKPKVWSSLKFHCWRSNTTTKRLFQRQRSIFHAEIRWTSWENELNCLANLCRINSQSNLVDISNQRHVCSPSDWHPRRDYRFLPLNPKKLNFFQISWFWIKQAWVISGGFQIIWEFGLSIFGLNRDAPVLSFHDCFIT